jgi:hypothetical protein
MIIISLRGFCDVVFISYLICAVSNCQRYLFWVFFIFYLELCIAIDRWSCSTKRPWANFLAIPEIYFQHNIQSDSCRNIAYLYTPSPIVAVNVEQKIYAIPVFILIRAQSPIMAQGSRWSKKLVKSQIVAHVLQIEYYHCAKKRKLVSNSQFIWKWFISYDIRLFTCLLMKN